MPGPDPRAFCRVGKAAKAAIGAVAANSPFVPHCVSSHIVQRTAGLAG